MSLDPPSKDDKALSEVKDTVVDEKKSAGPSKVEPAEAPARVETASPEKTAKDDADSDVPSAKRRRTEAAEEDEKETEEEVLDVAVALGLKGGDRLQVQWEITNEDGETITLWWGATLLEHDGRTQESVAIRVLEYDAYPEGGFQERSKEDAIFLGSDLLVDPSTHQEMSFRRIDDDDEPMVLLSLNEIEDVVNGILKNAMEKANWKSLPRAQQSVVAAQVAAKKEKLVQLLQDHVQEKRVLRAEDVPAILAQTISK
jgi:hypothetical protein